MHTRRLSAPQPTQREARLSMHQQKMAWLDAVRADSTQHQLLLDSMLLELKLVHAESMEVTFDLVHNVVRAQAMGQNMTAFERLLLDTFNVVWMRFMDVPPAAWLSPEAVARISDFHFMSIESHQSRALVLVQVHMTKILGDAYYAQWAEYVYTAASVARYGNREASPTALELDRVLVQAWGDDAQ